MEDPHTAHDEAVPGTGSRVIPGRGAIDRPAPAGSGKELPSPSGGRSLPPSPNPTNKERPTTARGNGYPPTTRAGRIKSMDPDELDDGRLRSVCPECGNPYTRDDTTAVCPECQPVRTRRPAHIYKGSARARGYTSAWDRLSLRARRLSPLCEDCGTTEDLTADHSPEAWKRHEQGLVLRLRDVSVVCRRCNAERGAARGALAYQHDQWSKHGSTLSDLVDEYDRDDDEA